LGSKRAARCRVYLKEDRVRLLCLTLAATLAGCATTEEPEPRSAPRKQAAPAGLRALDKLLNEGGVSKQSPAERQKQCLAKVARSQLCPRPAGQTRTLYLRLVLDERFAQQVPGWEQRLDKTLACVNRFFVPAGLRWQVASVEGWEPQPRRGDIRQDRARLARLRPPDLKSMVVGVVVWPAHKVKPRKGSRRLASCQSGTCAFVAWPRMETDCLTWAKNLARQVGAKLMPGRRWLVSVKYLRFLGLRGQANLLHQHYRLHPRNLEALKLARAARYTPQGLKLPRDCYDRLRTLDRCYFGGAPLAVTQVAACKRGKASACRGLGNLYARGHGVKKDMVTAAGYYRTACTGGDMHACEALGGLYYRGFGVPRDVKRAVGLLDRACKGGNLRACVNLAGLLRYDRRVPRDFPRALTLCEKACRGKLMRGCNALASMYSHGQGTPRDEARAAKLFRLSCESGDVKGCYSLALMVWRGQGVRRDRRAAVDLLQRGCDRGSPKSCESLASFFWAGREGQAKDHPRALSLYARACEMGYLKACSNEAAMHRDGKGTLSNRPRAAGLFKRACKGGFYYACLHLARMHFTGKAPGASAAKADQILSEGCKRGSGNCCQYLANELRSGKRLKRDPARLKALDQKTVALFHKGCDGGFLPACHGLARLRWHGRGVRRDRRAAVDAFRRGCQRKHTKSCYDLGLVYFKGLGGFPRDARKGRAMLTRACEEGFRNACRELGKR